MRYLVLSTIASIFLAATFQSDAVLAQDRKTVTLVQILLDDLGYDPGPLDGKAGARTRAAIGAFEERIGKPVTAKVSSGLVTELLEVSLAKRYVDLEYLDEDTLDSQVPSLRAMATARMMERLRSTGAFGDF